MPKAYETIFLAGQTIARDTQARTGARENRRAREEDDDDDMETDDNAPKQRWVSQSSAAPPVTLIPGVLLGMLTWCNGSQIGDEVEVHWHNPAFHPTFAPYFSSDRLIWFLQALVMLCHTVIFPMVQSSF